MLCLLLEKGLEDGVERQIEEVLGAIDVMDTDPADCAMKRHCMLDLNTELVHAIYTEIHQIEVHFETFRSNNGHDLSPCLSGSGQVLEDVGVKESGEVYGI